MARIEGVKQGGPLLGRFAFWLSRRKIGRVPKPLRIYALHRRLLMGYGQMEMAQEKAQRVPASVKSLASVLVALRVGCPF